MRIFKRSNETVVHPAPEASPEAKEALAEAKKIKAKADEVYSHRAELLQRNHFAERITVLYQGF